MRILVPVDFSASSRIAVDYATWLAPRLDAKVDVLNTMRSPCEAISSESFLRMCAEVHTQGSGGTCAGAPSRPIAEPSAVVRVSAAMCDTILSQPIEERDLIVVATRNPSRIADVIWWHLAEMLVRLAPCPVLTLRGVAPNHTDDERREAPAP